MLAGALGVMALTSCEKDDNQNNSGGNTGDSTTITETALLNERLAEMGPSEQVFTMDASRSQNITTAKGNIFSFPAFAFEDQSGNSVTGNVEIQITEVDKKSEMILSGMMTLSDEGALESQGEFNVEVFQNGQILKLKEGASYSIQTSNFELEEGVEGWLWDSEITRSSVQEGLWVSYGQNAVSPCEELALLRNQLDILNPLNQTAEISLVIERIKNLVNKVLLNEGMSTYAQTVIYPDNELFYGYYSFKFDEPGWKLTATDTSYLNNQLIVTDYSMWGLGDRSIPLADTTLLYLSDPNMEQIALIGCTISFFGPPNITLDSDVINLNVPTLGWCNLDRYLSEFGSVYNAQVTIEGAPVHAGVRFVFPELNGVLPASPRGNGTFKSDGRLPNGMPIIVVVYYQLDGVLYAGVQTIPASENMVFNTSNVSQIASEEALVELFESLD